MTVLPTPVRDPEFLASEVRDLAHEAHRALSGPVPDAPRTQELSRRISHLQHALGPLASADLSQWLENLRRQVDARAGSRPGRSKTSTSSGSSR